jgi:hypothetical protein
LSAAFFPKLQISDLWRDVSITDHSKPKALGLIRFSAKH